MDTMPGRNSAGPQSLIEQAVATEAGKVAEQLGRIAGATSLTDDKAVL